MKTFKWNDKNESFGIFHWVKRFERDRKEDIQYSWNKLNKVSAFGLHRRLWFKINSNFLLQLCIFTSTVISSFLPVNSFQTPNLKKILCFFFRMFRMILISFAPKLNRRNQAMLRTFHSRNGRIVQFQSASAKLKVALANWPKASPKHWITALPLIRRLIHPLP